MLDVEVYTVLVWVHPDFDGIVDCPTVDCERARHEESTAGTNRFMGTMMLKRRAGDGLMVGGVNRQAGADSSAGSSESQVRFKVRGPALALGVSRHDALPQKGSLRLPLTIIFRKSYECVSHTGIGR